MPQLLAIYVYPRYSLPYAVTLCTQIASCMYFSETSVGVEFVGELPDGNPKQMERVVRTLNPKSLC
jgi:predicted aconitase